VTARCDLTDLPESQCACRIHGKPEDQATAGVVRELPRPGWLEARYRGQCAGCGEPFAVGALITRDEGTGGWAAECCAEVEP